MKLGVRSSIPFVTLFPVLSLGVLSAQMAPIQPVTFRTSSQMVLIPVTVTDHRGKTVGGLRAQNFTVLDDQAPQSIVSFGGEDSPCAAGLVLDVSGSMRGTLAAAKDVAHAFLETSNPEDEFFLMTVSTKPESLSGFTNDIGTLEGSLLSAQPGGWTALIDTVYLGLGRMRTARRPRRALLILSDGMDNSSRYSKSELMRVALEADTQIYSIVVDTAPSYKKAIQLTEEHRGRDLLESLSEQTGGLHFLVRDAAEARNAAIKAAQAIRDQYVIGYQPQALKDAGRWHRVRVKADVPGTNVYARNGYYQ